MNEGKKEGRKERRERENPWPAWLAGHGATARGAAWKPCTIPPKIRSGAARHAASLAPLPRSDAKSHFDSKLQSRNTYAVSNGPRGRPIRTILATGPPSWAVTAGL